jgi:predicted phosphodiesterase
MRYAVMSDVHANNEALLSVLKDIKTLGINNTVFLGDAVGYGPDPNECVRILSNECCSLIAGNHDWAVLGLTDITYFNPHAKAAIEWTQQTIDDDCTLLLKRLPLSQTIENKEILLVHATPYEPAQWHYLYSLEDAKRGFESFHCRFCLIGHSHEPVIIEQRSAGQISVYEKEAKANSSSRYIINVGSVGQPRDGDPKAAYVIIDDDAMMIRRVPYDIKKTQKKMKRFRLPSRLIERLSMGV